MAHARQLREFGKRHKKKSASSHDEAALLGKKYHIAAKLVFMYDLCKFFRWKLNFFD